jgi:gliding motility-associated-like protein
MIRFYTLNLFLAILFSFSTGLQAQDFSNKGKEFWIPYSYHVGMSGGVGSNVAMTLYITSDVTTTYTVEIYGGANLQAGTINAGQVVTCVVPNTNFINAAGIFNNKTVRVLAEKPVVVYSYITQSAVSGATVCLPTNVLGNEYYSMNYTQVSNSANANSYFTIIAVEDNTTVEITPAAATTNGWAAGSVNTITLNKGQIYQVLGTVNNTPSSGLYSGVDLTGSKIRSVSTGTSSCKRIAVFSGAGKMKIGSVCSGGSNSSDNLYQQLYPAGSWGRDYLTVPSYNRPINFYRVMKKDPATNVYLNGTLIPASSFVNNRYYEFTGNTPNRVTADQPVSVSQYFTTANCSSNPNPYDPDMIILNPVEQNISKVTLVSSNLVAASPQHHIHVVMPTGGTGISSFRIDNNPIPASSWVVHPQNPAYAYAYLANVTQGYHTLKSDSGFNAMAYGYANAESYGYSAGANVKDLYQYISLETPNSSVNFPASCANTPFYLSMTFPYQPTTINWVFGAALNALGIADVSLTNPTPTSTVIVNGRTLYVYKLPTQYTVTASNIYPIKVLATNPTPDGCGGEQEINFDLEILNRPTAGFTFSGICANSTTQFTDASNTGVRPISSVNWTFGTLGTSTQLNPTYTFPAAGTYPVTYSLITDIGCRSDTITQNVTINPLPTATIAGTITTCINSPQPTITFTGAGATPPYTFTYNINGGATQTISTTGTASSVTVQAPTNVLGTFAYNLINVAESSTGLCSQNQTGAATITINTNPTASIAGTLSVCKDATPPQITFTGGDGTAPYTFTYNINGGATQTVSSVAPSNIATLDIPTGTAGTFTYNLVGVVDVNNTVCSGSPTGNATITVNPLPTATIAGTDTVCLNSTPPPITFTGSNGTAPYTFNYKINGGAMQSVTTTSGNSVVVNAPTATVGAFIYELISVTDASSTTCTQLQNGTATITVFPTPSATLNGTTAVCVNATSPQLTFTGADGDAAFTFTYTINGGATQTVTTTSGNSVSITAPTTSAGTFTYLLLTVTDANGATCAQNVTGNAIITVNPLPTATIAGSTSVCLNATEPQITFTGANATAPYTFSYTLNGGAVQTITTTSGNSATVNVPTSTAGTFTYALVSVTDASSTTCSQQQSGSAAVTVWPLPTAAYTTSSPVCQEGIISFTDQSTPNVGTLTSWQWNFNDPVSGALNTSTQQNPTHFFSTAGTFVVSLTVTTSNGCVSTNSLPGLVVHPKPNAGFIIPEVCLNDTYAQFTDTSSVATPSSITAWLWNFGDPNSTPPNNANTSTLQNPPHSYTAVGSYTVSLIVTSNQSCRDTIVQQLVVNGSFPVANFSVNQPANLCANDSVRITDASTVFPGVITKVEIWWDNIGSPTTVYTDNNPVFGRIYSHLYPNFQSPLTRTYQIRYRAYSGGVCMNEKFTTITVNAAPAVQFTAVPNICFDAPAYQITQATETGSVPGTFAFTGPGVSTVGLFTPSVAGVGIHTIKYVFTSSTGSCKDSATQTIKVWERAVANYSVTTNPVCEKQPVTFTDNSTSTEGTITEWRWDFADGTPVQVNTNNAPFTHTFNTYGTFNVKLNVVTSNGCVSADKIIPVTVNPLARPNFSFPAISCLPNATVQFTNLSTVPNGTPASLTYLWDFGDPGSGAVNNSTVTDPAHVYVNLGPYNINLEVTTAVGCIHDTTIVLNTIHPQPQASFTTDFIDVCIGSPFLFTSTSNGADGTILQYHWNLGDASIRTLSSFSYTYADTGTYTISHYIINSFGCSSNVATKTVFVNGYPDADAGPDKLMLEGGQVQITPPNNYPMPVTFAWTPPTYLDDPTRLDPIARPPDDITYLLTVTTNKGCSDTSSMFIKVLKDPPVPNIFSPNGDGVHDTWIIPYLDSYPGCTVEVVNRYGYLIFRSVGYATPWDGKVNGKDVPVGTYYYVIDPKNGRKKKAGYVDIIR